MEINIHGDPGTGNTYTEVKIDNVEIKTGSTTIINNNVSRAKSRSSRDGIEIDKKDISSKIIEYVKKIKDYVSDKWSNDFESLWNDIIKIKEVDADIYNRHGQVGTVFNRVMVAGIIRVLRDSGVYVKCTNTALAIALEGTEGKDHHVRQELGQYPSDEIRDAVKQLLQSEKYKTITDKKVKTSH